MKLILFTDLDGTLIEFKTYSFEKVVDNVELLKKQNVPIIFCSDKTRAEQEALRVNLDIKDPFIVEGGGAIFIPKDYFKFDFEYQNTINGYYVIELGISYTSIRANLKKIEKDIGLTIRGFGDMTAEEVAQDSGLSLESAKLAKEREYNETLTLEGSQAEIDRILKALETSDLRWVHGGRYISVMGGNDKGQAVEILSRLYQTKHQDITTVGIGDSLNDVPMLEKVDRSYLVQRPGNVWEDIELDGLNKVNGIGPEGWNQVVNTLLSE